MGTSHFESNIIGHSGTETITGFDKFQADDVVCGTVTATLVTAVNIQASTKVTASSYIKIGTQQYIFAGLLGTVASIVAVATALVGTPLIGSMYFGRRKAKAKCFWFKTDTTASPINLD